MPEIVDNQFPFKVYEVRNLANTEAYVYLGKATLADTSDTDGFFPHQVEENCYSTFLFASIVGGRNVRIDPATEEDPYIYIDSRWYTFRPCGYEGVEDWPANSVLSRVDVAGDGNVTAYLKSITTDGSVVIEGGNSTFVWSDQGPTGDQNNDPNFCDIILKTHKYDCANICDKGGIYSHRKGVPGKSDVVFFFKSLFEGYCIKLDETSCGVRVSFDVESCSPANLSGDPPVIVDPAYVSCTPGLSGRPGWKFVS